MNSLFLLAPLGCIYYPIEILPNFFQIIAKGLPLVYIFDETRNILINGFVNYENLKHEEKSQSSSNWMWKYGSISCYSIS